MNFILLNYSNIYIFNNNNNNNNKNKIFNKFINKKCLTQNIFLSFVSSV